MPHTAPDRLTLTASRWMVRLTYGIFCFSGFNTTLLSVLAPRFSGQFTDAALGAIFAAQYTGQLLGPLFLFGQPVLALLGGLILSAACAAYFSVSGQLPPLLLGLYGLGLGAVMAATNVLVGAVSTESERKSRIERLNFFWPLSALCTPLIVTRLQMGGPVAPFGLVAFNSILTILPIAALCYRFRAFRLQSLSASGGGQHRVAQLALLCLLAALACGAESALFSWAPTFAARFTHRAHGMEFAVGAFWAGLLSGRLGASFLVAKTEGKRLNTIASLVCACSIAVLAAGKGEASMVFAFFVAGGSVASIYPAIISDGLPLAGSQFIFVSAGIGSAALPWLTGRASAAGNSLRWAQWVPAAACVLLGFLDVYSQKHLRGAAASNERQTEQRTQS